MNKKDVVQIIKKYGILLNMKLNMNKYILYINYPSVYLTVKDDNIYISDDFNYELLVNVIDNHIVLDVETPLGEPYCVIKANQMIKYLCKVSDVNKKYDSLNSLIYLNR